MRHQSIAVLPFVLFLLELSVLTTHSSSLQQVIDCSYQLYFLKA